MFKQFRTILLLCLAAVVLTGAVSGAVTQTENEQVQYGQMATLIYSVVPSGDGYSMSVNIDGQLYLMKTDAKFKEVLKVPLTGGRTQGLAVTNDGGCVFILVSDSGATLCRVDKEGKTVWESPLYDMSFGVNPFVINGDEIVVAGWFTGTNTGVTQSYSFKDGVPANNEFRLENKVPNSILFDGNGYVLVGGTLSEECAEGSAAWIMKMQNGGKIVFEKTIRENCDEENAASYGGGYGACAYALCKTSEGYYVVGTQMPYSFDAAKIFGQIWGARIDKDGEIIWQKDLYGSVPMGVAEIGGQYLIAGEGVSTAFSVFVTPDGIPTRMNYLENSVGMFYSLDNSKPGRVVLGGCLNKNDYGGLFGLVSVFEDSEAASSPVPLFGVISGVIGAGVLFALRRK